jgi:hypothetical protein
VERGDAAVDLALRGADGLAQLAAGQRAERADRRDQLSLEPVRLLALRLRDERRHHPRCDAGGHTCDVLADADQPARGQLVLRAPQKAHAVRPADERPVGLADGDRRSLVAGEPAPQGRQDDVRLGEEEREADVVDPVRRCLERAHH